MGYYSPVADWAETGLGADPWPQIPYRPLTVKIPMKKITHGGLFALMVLLFQSSLWSATPPRVSAPIDSSEKQARNLASEVQNDPRMRSMLKGDPVTDQTNKFMQSSLDYSLAHPDSHGTRVPGRKGKPLAFLANKPRFGGIGYGVYLSNNFVEGWDTLTSIQEHVIVPRNFGGSNPGEIANTQTNGSAHGVEVVLSYVGQNDAKIIMYDWSIIRASTPLNYAGGPALVISFGDLCDYLNSEPCSDVVWRQQLWFYNYTYLVDGATNTWRNLIIFRNYRTYTWDIVYSHDYYWDKINNPDMTPMDEDGNSAPIGGNWGPILEEVSNQSPSGAFRPQGCENVQVMRDVDAEDGYFQLGPWMSFSWSLSPDPAFVQSQIYFTPNYAYACGSRAGEFVRGFFFPGSVLNITSLKFQQGTATADGLRVAFSYLNIATPIIDGPDSKYPFGWGQIIQGNKYVLQLDLKADAACIAQNSICLAYGLRDTSGVNTVARGWAFGGSSSLKPDTMQRVRFEFTAPSTTIVRPYVWASGWEGSVTIKTISLILE